MQIAILPLGARLSGVSWFFVELFTASALFFLPFSKSAAEISCFVAIALWGLRKFPWDEALPRLRRVDAAYLAFFLCVIASLLQAGDANLSTAARGVFKWGKFLLLFWMAAELGRRPGAIGRLLTVFVVSTGLASLNGFYQLATGTDLVKGYSIHVPGRFLRIKGSFPSPNGLAIFASLALPVAFARMAASRAGLRRAAWAAAFAILFAALILTLSRGAVLALFGVSMLLFVRRRNFRAALALFASPSLFLLSPTLRANFLDSLKLSDITIGERVRFSETSLRMIADSPLFGHGVNLFYVKSPAFAAAGDLYRGYAHNCYLQLWAELGAIGLAAFAVPLILFAARFWRESGGTWDDRAAVGLGLAAFLVHAAADTHFFALQPATLFWILFGLWHAPLISSPARPTSPIFPSRG